MAQRLTDIGVKALKAATAYYEVADASGLRVGVQPIPSTVKSFLTRYRRPTGETAKLTHGRYPQLGLAEARIRHAEACATVAAGIDPGESKRRDRLRAQEVEANRCADTVELHVKEHLERQRRPFGVASNR